ncbi:MAG: UDP-N-acetylmuramate--L-alanine ligase [Candidatus Woesebacteria bacterium]|nr:UDP-N-acetylmuramate--L-alanine ligase [Candidatus Woesebacteria bacterium]
MSKIKKVHFMGVGGSGMSGVSFLAFKAGYEITGCDIEESTAYSNKFFHGHSPDHLKNVDLLVVTPAVYFQKVKSSELVLGEKRNIVLSWQKFLGKYLHKGKKVICIAGTHGKSTTTAMVGKLLEDAGLDPQVTVGANYGKWGGGARYGNGDYFVTEADEFFDNFLNYSPDVIILNNTEFDHPDYFKSEEQIFESYKKFIGKLTGEKVLIVNSDSGGVQKILKEIDTSKLKVIKYSLNDKNPDLNLKVIGKHNVANALGVIALGKYLKIKEDVIIKSLEGFGGIGRRMELISDLNGIKVFDDYAHHPTAIKATLDALNEKYPESRIWAVYEAHSYIRTKALLTHYKGVFEGADKVVIGPIFKARDNENFGINEESIKKASEHKDVACFDDNSKMFKYLKDNLKSGDIVLVMGAGKSYLWAREICNLKI